jgi:hypothetical protein
MESLDRLITGIKHVDELIAEDVLEPDLARADWSGMKPRAKLLYEAVRGDVLDTLEDALFDVRDENVVLIIKRRVATLLGEAVAPIYASGDAKSFLSLLGKAAELAPDPEHRAALGAGSAEPEGHCRLQHARWLQNRDRFREADKILKRVIAEAKHPALKQAAKKARNAPRPVEKAPPLFRLNGCGAALYGERDTGTDGSYIATYCICLLFIPVFPLSAYRVRRADGDMYQFGTKERLGPIARAWQAIVLAGVVLAIGWGGVTSYMSSPTRLAKVAQSEAAALEASGDREGAVQRYKDVIRTYLGITDVTPAAEAVVRLTAAGVTEPATPESVDQITRILNGFMDLPAGARGGAPASLLVSRLGAWADQIGDSTAAHANAGLLVLDMAAKVAETDALPSLHERRSKLRRALAEKVASERPLQALMHYVQLPDGAAIDAAKGILDTFGDAPSLWIEAEQDVSQWVASASRGGRSEDAGVLRAKLERARDASAEDKKVIEAGDEKAIEKALAASPGNQELAVALAAMRRARGDLKGATALLTAIGPPGRLTGDAQLVLGHCHADAGDLDKADQVLAALLNERLPSFQQARREYTGAAQKLREKTIREAELGMAPKDLDRRMQGASKDEQPNIFAEWLAEQMAADPEIARLRAEYLRHGAVVPASIALGTVKLRRARDASGEARKALLKDAERVFLGIRQEAEGDPTFHLGLGQVYHRLGRTEDGDAELKGVLDRNDPSLSLAVAHVYRELGHMTRAEQLAKRVYESSSDAKIKQSAAFFLAHIVGELEEKETWLARTDVTSPQVKNMQVDVEARRLVRDGKLAEADRVFAKVSAFHERDAKNNAAASNNAAIAYLSRYGVTGDPAHLRAAVSHLEASVRLDGENAIVLGHLADALEYLGLVTVADTWVHTRTLMLGADEAFTIIETMLDGPLRAEVLEALRKEPSYRRALEISKQEQILSPQKPSAYARQIRWLKEERDAAGLAELAKRIAALPPFPGEDVAEGRKAWEAGEKDEQYKRSFNEALTQAHARVSRAQKEGHKPTQAAALMMLSGARSMLRHWDLSASSVEEMVKAFRGAHEAWPELASGRELGGVLMVAAIDKAVLESPALHELWKAERRTFDYTSILHHVMAAPNAGEMLAALRKQPELGEAARLIKPALALVPTISDWVLARAAGDAEMEQAAAKVFERVDLEHALKLDVALYGGQAREKAELELFLSKGAAPR